MGGLGSILRVNPPWVSGDMGKVVRPGAPLSKVHIQMQIRSEDI